MRPPALRSVSEQRRRPLREAAAIDDQTEDQLSRKVQRNLSLREEDPSFYETNKSTSPNHEPKESTAQHDKQESCEEALSQEMGELAGYFGELYLPRARVSADAALMVELMYT